MLVGTDSTSKLVTVLTTAHVGVISGTQINAVTWGVVYRRLMEEVPAVLKRRTTNIAQVINRIQASDRIGC